ncbi:MAG: glycosyltransferase, partial [Actinomycetota bacterium]|nr:glycosyltransferase [Actinomycetota bacterium]
MRLLMLSWRYVGHPQAGGAEVLTHEVLRRLVERGWKVTCFTAAHPGAEPEDDREGVALVRRGRQWTVHVEAYRWLRHRLDGYDVVIDQTNTIPFFTPLYVPRDKQRLFIHQLAREYWFRETRGAFRLVAPVGYALEPLQLRLYRKA